MTSPNKEKAKLEPRTTHVPKLDTKKIQRDMKYLTRHGTNQPNQGKPRIKWIPWPGTEGERYGLEDWTNSKFEISTCGSNANIRMSYKPEETVYPGVEPKQPHGN